MLGKAASEGRFSQIERKVDDYELLMSNRQQFGYDVPLVSRDRSDATIYVNRTGAGAFLNMPRCHWQIRLGNRSQKSLSMPTTRS